MNTHARINMRAYLVAMVKDRRQIELTRDCVTIVLFMPMPTGYSMTCGTGSAFVPFGEVVGEAMYALIYNQNIDVRG